MNDVDREALAYMARDAANGKESSISNENARNEAAVFAAMVLDKENRPAETPVVTTEDIARGIYSRVRALLRNPDAVAEICNGKMDRKLIPGETIVEQIEALCNIGYFYSHDTTNLQEVCSLIRGSIRTCKSKGDMDKVEILNGHIQTLEDTMMSAAIPVISAGIEDGSIDRDFASKTDEEIIETLTLSDGTKEAAIQEGFFPTMKRVMVEESHLMCSGTGLSEEQ